MENNLSAVVVFFSTKSCFFLCVYVPPDLYIWYNRKVAWVVGIRMYYQYAENSSKGRIAESPTAKKKKTKY